MVCQFAPALPGACYLSHAGFRLRIGKFKIKKFMLGTVTSVLLVGVLIGQLHIDIGAPLKSVFFSDVLVCRRV